MVCAEEDNSRRGFLRRMERHKNPPLDIQAHSRIHTERARYIILTDVVDVDRCRLLQSQKHILLKLDRRVVELSNSGA